MARNGGDSIAYTGLDSETFKGKAILLATPDHSADVGTWAQCLAFLRRWGPDYCLWNLSYDARAVLAYLPGTILADLRRHGTTLYRGRWLINYTARKSLKITDRADDCRIRFWDVYPYYSSSLDKAAEKYLGEHKADIPKAWLEDMATALRKHRRRVVKYCKRDAGLTQRLWEICEAQYLDLGVDPYHAASPASLAVRAFPDSYGFKSVPGYLQRTFQNSYYGGRSEIYQRGNVGRVYCYDIHSAYPSVLRTLLDPRGCTEAPARRAKPPRTDAAYGAYRVYVEIDPETHIAPLPFRSKSLPLVYPAGAFTVWTDKDSLDMLLEEGVKVRVLDGIELLIDTETILFPDLEKWYLKRRECPAVSLAIKKTLNSVYGKLAELRPIRVPVTGRELPNDAVYHGGKWTRRVKVPTPHTHFAVAAAVTAGCRRRLYEAMRLDPSAIVACHTDGIISKRKLELDVGDELGQWGLEHAPDECIALGVGMYLYREGDEWTERTRGLHLSRPLRELLTEKTPTVELKLRHAYTMADAERIGWSRLNEMVEVKKTVDVNMDRKRAWTRPFHSFQEAGAHRQRSRTLIVVDKWALRHESPKARKRRKKACKRRRNAG